MIPSRLAAARLLCLLLALLPAGVSAAWCAAAAPAAPGEGRPAFRPLPPGGEAWRRRGRSDPGRALRLARQYRPKLAKTS